MAPAGSDYTIYVFEIHCTLKLSEFACVDILLFCKYGNNLIVKYLLSSRDESTSRESKLNY